LYRYYESGSPRDGYADFLREYEECRQFWEWRWQTFPELAEKMARRLLY
jgi:hypothetical protein